MYADQRAGQRHADATSWPSVFFVISLFFVYRSFYGMRIEAQATPEATPRPVAVKA